MTFRAPFLRLRGAATALAVVALAFACARASAGPYVWDQDEDGLDDRMETVQLLGYRFAFVNADTLAPLRFQVTQTLSGLVYTTYVVYDHQPTDADLTTLTVRNGGTFPRASVEADVTGKRETPAHGSAEMPVWGPIFRTLDPKDAAANKVRIRNIVDHVELLQRRP